jgi:hypothetical protein
MKGPAFPETVTCATCPWLADDWYRGALIGAKRCGFHLPSKGGRADQHHPPIPDPGSNGCSFHPVALAWAQAAQVLLEPNPFLVPEPAPEPPADPTPRRRAIRG